MSPILFRLVKSGHQAQWLKDLAQSPVLDRRQKRCKELDKKKWYSNSQMIDAKSQMWGT